MEKHSKKWTKDREVSRQRLLTVYKLMKINIYENAYQCHIDHFVATNMTLIKQGNDKEDLHSIEKGRTPRIAGRNGQ